MAKATFTVGVFGLACRKDGHGKLRIKVNIRDQERQKRLAGLPADAKVKIIDIPGGGVEFKDFPIPEQANLFQALQREIREETRGCEIESLGEFRGPFMVITNNDRDMKAAGDLAFWMPIEIHGDPKPSDEALGHPWISREELETENVYRCVGKLGKAGRTGRMIRAAFDFYETAMVGQETSFEWTEIAGMSGPVEHVLLSGNPDCDHNYEPISRFEKYEGQCRICKKCGRVETYPAPGELCKFYGMSGEYIVEDDGSPGLGM